ncbi:MAG: methionyl-tRNA formyltransferase [Planctomycetota bacterium]|jgi:methionyl-tRNA formyltransferase
MRILFFGTPEFAVPSFNALVESRHEVVGVVCQPDRPSGRGRNPAHPPVGGVCSDLGLPLLQPEKLRPEELERLFKEHCADAGVVVAYGKILRKWLLGLPRRGFINVHASILPRFRGAAPVARAVMEGEKETGVSIMFLDEGIDTGPVYLVKNTPIGPDETAGELETRLSEMGAEALVEALDGIEEGTLSARPQEGEASYASLLTKEDGILDWDAPAAKIHDRVRGVNPWPGARATFRDGPVRIWRTSRTDEPCEEEPGRVILARKSLLRVAAGRGALDIQELQLPGKRRVGPADFINGTRLKAGERFH